MGIDGFSMSNLGMQRNLTSAQLAHEVDVTAKQALENQIADVDGVGKKEKAGRKDPDAAFNGTIPFIPDEEDNDEGKDESEQDKEQTSSDEETQDESDINENEDDDEGGQYHFKLNDSGMIEVWSTETNTMIKEISPEDAAKTFINLSQAPGLFVNRKI